jgi:hypothetical protein
MFMFKEQKDEMEDGSNGTRDPVNSFRSLFLRRISGSGTEADRIDRDRGHLVVVQPVLG